MRNVILCAAGLLAAPAVAQTAQPMVIGQANTNTLLTGTSVPLRTLTQLSTKEKSLKVGDRFDLEVAEAVTLNGVTVIPVGARAVGEITAVRYKGMWGKSGHIEARLLYVRANNRQIRLSGRLDDKGKTGALATTAVTAASAVVLLPVGGFLVTGTSAVIAPGTQVIGYLDEDMPVVFAPGAASASPMVVATPAGGATPAPK